MFFEFFAAFHVMTAVAGLSSTPLPAIGTYLHADGALCAVLVLVCVALFSRRSSPLIKK
jgi:hypothetical protein